MIFRGERRHHQPPRKAVEGQQEHQEGEQERCCVEGQRRPRQQKAYIDTDKKQQLDQQLDKVGSQCGQRDDQAREIHFPEDAGIGRERA